MHEFLGNERYIGMRSSVKKKKKKKVKTKYGHW